MGAQIIDGKAFAKGLGDNLRLESMQFENLTGRKPGLAVVLVGHDPASEVYVRSKARMAKVVGMESFEHRLDADTPQAALMALIARLNADEAVDGILVQLPLPDGLDQKQVINAIRPDKDVDGLHPINAGYLASGLDGIVSCTPLGCLMLLKAQLGSLRGLDAVVVGRSILVGRPMAQLLLQEDCTVTIAHRHSVDLRDKLSRADIVVAAAGQPQMIKGEWLKQGAVVIDVGINRIPDGEGHRLVGDVDTASVMARARAVTPVPGGVGPMTIMTLMHNTIIAAFRRNGLVAPQFI